MTLVNFGSLAAMGGALAAWVALARQQQAGMDPERYALLLFGALPLLIVVGSRAFSLALDWRAFVRAPLVEALKPGFAFHGGLVGAAAGVVAVALYADLNILLLMDSLALGVPLGHAIGRLGCHTYGCCHGRPTMSPWAIRYTNPDSKAVWRSGLRGVPLHPTQLYSAFGNLALFVVLAGIASGDVRAGQIAATYLVLGSAGRFLVEFLRGGPTSRLLGLSIFQWAALGLIACGLGLSYVAWGNPVHGRFADLGALVESLRYTSLSLCPLLVFAVIFVCFGVQGRQVGHFAAQTGEEIPCAALSGGMGVTSSMAMASRSTAPARAGAR